MACNKCGGIPQPVYSKATSLLNTSCDNCGGNQINTGGASGGGTRTELLEGNQIGIDNLSVQGIDRFRINHIPLIPLEISMSVIPLIAEVDAREGGTPYVLDGRVVQKVIQNWTYNKNVDFQSLSSSDGSINFPVLGVVERTNTTPNLTLMVNTVFTITADDGTGQDGGSGSVSASVLFGNYFRWGTSEGFKPSGNTSLVGGDVADVQAQFDGLVNSEVRGNQRSEIRGLGGPNLYTLIMWPKSWGLRTMQLGSASPGGYIRLKNVANVLTAVDANDKNDTDSGIFLDNGFGTVEYYVYQSTYDNQENPDTPLKIVTIP